MNDQKEFDVIGYMTITVHTKVHARSAKEARQIASKRQPIDLCRHCAGSDDLEEIFEAWCPLDLDGTPDIQHVEERRKR